MENSVISNFNSMNLSPEMMRGLNKMNFAEPTPVQAATVLPMLEGGDLIVQAPTGTGKTGAFGIPVVERVDSRNQSIQTVILCPTRELAIQTASVLKKLTAFKPGVRVLALYGGEPIGRQIAALRRRPQIIVATPGRMMDHMNRRTTRLQQVSCVVLDEADRMLDMGFREDIGTILQGVSPQRQTVLFSATMSDGIKRIASRYQQDAKHIRIAQDTLTVEQVEQYYCEIRGQSKTSSLVELLTGNQFPLSLVFVSTKSMADTLSQTLTRSGFRADALHGDLRQSQRDRVMDKYRSGKVNVLVATDVAARGIDVKNIDAVINYDIPGDSESYVHRIGRTGRANQLGLAYTFVYPKERGKLQGIIRDTGAAILPTQLSGSPPISYTLVEPPKHKAGARSGGGNKNYRKRNNSRGRRYSGHSEQGLQAGA